VVVGTSLAAAIGGGEPADFPEVLEWELDCEVALWRRVAELARLILACETGGGTQALIKHDLD
jgi:hypothetical protein